jgi:serine/threonine protein kinase/Tfp pilus assembly protein PilF
MIGKLISHYRILEKIGEGGMGVVYKAEDTRLLRSVALKFLPPHLLVNEDDRKRFAHEAQASAALSHSNIATVFEIDESEAGTFIALEFIAGQSLAERIKSGPLKLNDALSITTQICEGLQAAHERGIVHRDIKSQNIMVTTRGQVKILDFGLAKLRGATIVTKAGTTVGTMGYMSPEQLRGEAVDHRTDLWAAGVVLYEMIAGRRPFQGDYEDAVAYQITGQQPEPLTAIRTGVPMELERIVNKLLSKNVAERYQSATDLLVDLRASQKTVDESGKSTPSATPVASPRWKSRLIQIGVGGSALLLLLAAGVFYFALGPNPSRPIRSLAVLPFVNLSNVADQEYFADGMTDQLITELCKIHSVRVISRTSAMEFKGKHLPLPEIARTLNVDGIITATVLRSGERVRINAQLTRGATDENLWAETYERNTADILELHSAIARTIAQQIRAVLTPVEERTLSAARAVNPEAFDLVARGNYILNTTANVESFEKAKQLMHRAVEIDPNYADAQIGYAFSLIQSINFGFKNAEEVALEAEQAIERAMEIDPQRGRAYSLRGQLLWLRGDIAGCLEAHRKAVELSPNDGFIRTNNSWMLMAEGKYDDGVREGEKAVELDPLSHYARCNLMGWYYAVGRFADSRAEAGRILELDSTWGPAYEHLYRIAYHEGKLEEAIAHARKMSPLYSGGKVKVPDNVSWPEFKAWDLRTLDHLAGIDASYVGWAAFEFAMFGEKEKAFHWLEVALTQAQPVMLLLFYPDFDCLRDDVRFKDLVSRIHLPIGVYCTVGQGSDSRAAGKKIH